MNELAWVWLVGGLVLGGGIGAAIVFYMQRGQTQKQQQATADLTEQLASKNAELEQYKEHVLEQFSVTAQKFKTLDESYHDLHRHLAASSVALCGDQATQLLAGPSDQAKALEAADATELDASIEETSEVEALEIEQKEIEQNEIEQKEFEKKEVENREIENQEIENREIESRELKQTEDAHIEDECIDSVVHDGLDFTQTSIDEDLQANQRAKEVAAEIQAKEITISENLPSSATEHSLEEPVSEASTSAVETIDENAGVAEPATAKLENSEAGFELLDAELEAQLEEIELEANRLRDAAAPDVELNLEDDKPAAKKLSA